MIPGAKPEQRGPALFCSVNTGQFLPPEQTRVTQRANVSLAQPRCPNWFRRILHRETDGCRTHWGPVWAGAVRERPIHLSSGKRRHRGLCCLRRWYYGNINRVKAEKLLLASQNKDGSFLVRISESHSDEYTISGECWRLSRLQPGRRASLLRSLW